MKMEEEGHKMKKAALISLGAAGIALLIALLLEQSVSVLSKRSVKPFTDVSSSDRKKAGRVPGSAGTSPLSKPETRSQEVPLESSEVQPRVVDQDTRQPIEGASVKITVYDKDGGKEEFLTTTRSDGTFTAPQIGENQEYSMTIQHEDYIRLVRNGTGKIEGRFTLSRGGKIIGYVWNEAGKPLDVAKVSSDCDLPVVIDGNKFQMTLSEHKYTLHVQPKGYYYYLTKEVCPRKGETQIVHITSQSAAEGIEVRGKVCDTDGSPIEGVAISLWSPPSEFLRPDPPVTDASGNYALKLPKKLSVFPLDLSFHKDGYGYVWKVRYNHGPPAEMDVVMGNSASSIEGTVAASGAPFEGNLYLDWRFCEQAKVEVVQGKFTAEGVLPGSRSLTFQIRGYLPIIVNVEVPKEKPATVDIAFTDHGGTITGRVLNFRGEPVEAKVTYGGSFERFCAGQILEFLSSVETDVAGKYTITGLNGRYSLQAHPKDNESLEMSLSVTVSVSPGEVIRNADLVVTEKEK